MSTAGAGLTCAMLLELSKISRSNNGKRIDFKGMHVPLQKCTLRKMDVTTNEWRFAQKQTIHESHETHELGVGRQTFAIYQRSNIISQQSEVTHAGCIL
jgi:hypothetical protein